MKSVPRKKVPTKKEKAGEKKKLARTIRKDLTAGKRETSLDWAMFYHDLGWVVIDVPRGAKSPTRLGWPTARPTREQIQERFATEMNIGVLMGEASGGLIDIDLDCDETVALAPYFLPETELEFGRNSRPKSHRLYKVNGDIKTAKWLDTKSLDGKRKSLVEVRSETHQTIMPGSVHPSGDKVRFDKDGEPATVSAEKLKDDVDRLASAALLARHWPAEGERQDGALATAGDLLRRGWNKEETEHFIGAVAMVAGDEEADKRVAVVGPTEEKILAGEPATGGPTLAGLFGEDVYKKLGKWLGGEASPARREKGRKKKEGDQKTMADKLVDLTADTDRFHDDDGKPYASIALDGHMETHAVEGEGFRTWLRRSYHGTYKRAVTERSLKDGIGMIVSICQFDGEKIPVSIRIGGHKGSVCVDLGDKTWRVVVIDAEGWRIVESCDSPVRFVRPKGMLPLPVPERPGSFSELERLLPLDVENRQLLIGWLVGSFNPDGPYQLLSFLGEQDSGKSVTSRMIKSFVDPTIAPLRPFPKDERDLIIAATRAWCLAFDNLSKLPDWLSDALCRLSTDGGYVTRKLYADGELVIFEARRPIILNGIEDIVRRPDLISRSILLTLSPIDPRTRLAEKGLWRQVQAATPQILAGICDAVSCAIRNEANVTMDSYPRMADFVRWVVAAEEALPWEKGEFLRCYTENQNRAIAKAIESSPACMTLVAFMVREGSWQGTMKELWEDLDGELGDRFQRPKAWPHSPKGLSGLLRRYAPSLRQLGVVIERGTRSTPNGNHVHRLSYAPPGSSERSEPGPTHDTTELTEDELQEFATDSQSRLASVKRKLRRGRNRKRPVRNDKRVEGSAKEPNKKPRKKPPTKKPKTDE